MVLSLMLAGIACLMVLCIVGIVAILLVELH